MPAAFLSRCGRGRRPCRRRCSCSPTGAARRSRSRACLSPGRRQRRSSGCREAWPGCFAGRSSNESRCGARSACAGLRCCAERPASTISMALRTMPRESWTPRGASSRGRSRQIRAFSMRCTTRRRQTRWRVAPRTRSLFLGRAAAVDPARVQVLGRNDPDLDSLRGRADVRALLGMRRPAPEGVPPPP